MPSLHRNAPAFRPSLWGTPLGAHLGELGRVVAISYDQDDGTEVVVYLDEHEDVQDALRHVQEQGVDDCQVFLAGEENSRRPAKVLHAHPSIVGH